MKLSVNCVKDYINCTGFRIASINQKAVLVSYQYCISTIDVGLLEVSDNINADSNGCKAILSRSEI